MSQCPLTIILSLDRYHLPVQTLVCVRACVPAGAVLFNHAADDVCRCLAVRDPDGMVVLPNWLYGHTCYPLLKLLHAGQLFPFSILS